MLKADKDVTGRDKPTILKALIYAIAAIESLPKEKQEWSDKEDMREILKEHFGKDYEQEVLDTYHHGILLLFPRHVETDDERKYE